MVRCTPHLIYLLLVVAPVHAATIRVPSEQPTIQAGIDVAMVGDTVLVGPGTYFENVIVDRTVTLLSETGAEGTTIDGRNLDPVVFVQGDADHVVIEGFRITHGNWYSGGIYVDTDGSNTVVRRNIVEYNVSVGGAAIYSFSSPIIEDNVIQHNQCIKGEGAAAVSGRFERNVVRYNWGLGNLHNMTVWNADEFAWNIVVDNDGGWNEIAFTGGGVIHNNTFSRDLPNTPTVALSGSAPYVFRNNLIIHGANRGLDCNLNGPHTIRCNNVWGIGPHYTRDCEGLEGIDGNFAADPLFCDPILGDYRLQPGSPCAPANSPPGCGLIGALPVCAAAGIDGTAPRHQLSLRVEPNPASVAWTDFVLSHELEGAAIEIYDSAGRLVDMLRPTGTRIRWEGAAKNPRGVYFARLTTGAATEVVKFVMVR